MSSPRFAVRPPEFFPRISFFALLGAVDIMVLGDTFPRSRQSHQNRTPIRTPDGRMWLSLPVARPWRDRALREVGISREEYDPGRLWRAIRFNYEATPFFVYYADAVRALLYEPPGSLAAMCIESTRMLAGWLHVQTPIRLASDLVGEPADLVGVVRCVAGRYVASGETAMHDGAIVPVDDIAGCREVTYDQAFGGFERDLSALDLLFNLGPRAGDLLREGTEGP